jgi:hypothetical protein
MAIPKSGIIRFGDPLMEEGLMLRAYPFRRFEMVRTTGIGIVAFEASPTIFALARARAALVRSLQSPLDHLAICVPKNVAFSAKIYTWLATAGIVVMESPTDVPLTALQYLGETEEHRRRNIEHLRVFISQELAG